MKITLCAMIVALLGGFTLAASAAPDVAAGKALYATCAACHGGSAGGNAALKAPRLSHLGSVYLSAQLEKFRSGVRGGEGATPEALQMAGMAATLVSSQAVADVVAYIDTLQSEASAITVDGDTAFGADYYNQLCGACHSGDAMGNEVLNSPRLVGSDDWYVLAQLQAFRASQRGAHPEDRSGRQMRAMAGVLPHEQALQDVVTFIRSLEP